MSRVLLNITAPKSYKKINYCYFLYLINFCNKDLPINPVYLYLSHNGRKNSEVQSIFSNKDKMPHRNKVESVNCKEIISSCRSDEWSLKSRDRS